MNVYHSFDRRLSIVTVVVIATATCTRVMADIPFPGGVVARTPYTETAEPNVAQVKEAREQANECRCIKEARVRGSKEPIYGRYIGFLTTKTEPGQMVEDRPSFELTLHQKDGKKVSVALSDVATLKVIRTKGRFLGLIGREKTLLEVVLFPTITPEALLEKPIRYRDLRDNYTTTVAGWVYVRDKGGKPLCLVAKESGVYRVLARVKDLETKREILFDNNRDERCLWWAVHSVVEDSAYPYRLRPTRD
jgi:hypothetical protein